MNESRAVQNDIVDSLRSEMIDRFDVDSDNVRIVRSPYRICPLGAHIDHQHGPVTAMAIDRGVLLAFAPLRRPHVQMASINFSGVADFSLDAISDKVSGDWGNFPRGAARALQRSFRLKNGVVGVSAGRLDGGGLSSSAAMGVACLLALEDANSLSVTAQENIALHNEIENGYLGLRIGILDQAAILFSRRDHLAVIDCATATHTLIRRHSEAPPFKILIAFSGLKQALTGTDYNRRVEECREAARVLLKAVGREQSEPILGNVSPKEFSENQHRLKSVAARRATHFFSEVSRVQQGVQAWTTGDLTRFGQLMTESGWSSIKNYECGAPPLVDLFEILIGTPGVLGARFSGAGFRGCCVAIVADAAADTAVRSVQCRYATARPELSNDAHVFLCQSADGAEVID